MREWLILATEYAIVVIDALALVVVVVGTVEAFISGLRLFSSSPSGHEKRDAVGRIAAVAIIRTFLNFFLERDLAEVRERQETRGPAVGEQ